MSYFLAKAILICWPTAMISFFASLIIGFPYCGRKDLTQSIMTWPQLFSALRGEYGVRAMIYGIVFSVSLVTGVIGFGSFFIGGIFLS